MPHEFVLQDHLIILLLLLVGTKCDDNMIPGDTSNAEHNHYIVIDVARCGKTVFYYNGNVKFSFLFHITKHFF